MSTSYNLIPGATAVGVGFNALGALNSTSLMSQIYLMTELDNQTWQDPNSEQTYAVPDNMSVLNVSSGAGSANVFQDASSYQQSIAQDAQIDFEYGEFSGQLSEAYSNITSEQNSVYYGVYSQSWNSWQVNLASNDLSNVDPAILSSKLYTNVPSVFDQSNPQAFFDFFDYYGTHYVKQVSVGGRLDYYLAIDQSYSSDTTTLEANVSLEYNAVFIDASAQASVDWSTLSQNWANSRQVSLNTVGGNDQILVQATPEYDTNNSGDFQNWLAGVNDSPSITQYTLGNISDLWSDPDTINAVNQAVSYYLNQVIIAEAMLTVIGGSTTAMNEINESASMSITIAGNAISPATTVAPEPDTQYFTQNAASGNAVDGVINAGWQIAIYNSALTTQKFSNIYYLGSFTDAPTMYSQMMSDLDNVNLQADDYFIAACNMPSNETPNSGFLAWLQNFGATLQNWQNYIGPCGYYYNIGYTCIGQYQSPTSAVEGFNSTEPDPSDDSFQTSYNVQSLVFMNPSQSNAAPVKSKSSNIAFRGIKTGQKQVLATN